ncbi:MAG: molybdopterin molybdotransferase MoeA [Akkermansiaceae bacterium]|nr:molybdopterin molybdotransferase MoeA [Akkermansiaceae bacterium]
MQNLISVTQAESIIREHLDRAPVEFVHLDDAHGRYLREDILADRPLPPFDRVMMDGIAIAIASFTSGNTSFPIAGTQAAGSAPLSLENSSTCIEVMTGCVLPHGCDCVIPIELIDLSENTATLIGEVIPKQGQHIHPMGNDTEKGAALLQSSVRLGAAELAIAASVGATKLRVSSLPTIFIITTGDELVAPETEPLPHQIRRSHATALEALITSMNLGVVKSTHLKDDPSALKEAITDALPSYDILILTGGVSRGKYDYVAPVLTELLGTPHFHGIAQRPGKPMAFWTHAPDNVSTAGADDGSAAGGEECKRARADDGAAEGKECKRLIFALPGNPVSVMACTTRYLIPSLKEILSTRPSTKNTLSTCGSFHCPPHFTGLVPCKMKNGRIQLTPPSNSGNFLALANSDGIAELPGELTGKELLNEAANFYPWS